MAVVFVFTSSCKATVLGQYHESNKSLFVKNQYHRFENQQMFRQISPGEERGVGCEEQSGRRTMPTKIGGGVFSIFCGRFFNG